jgi:lysophospholipase L1-like esterase
MRIKILVFYILCLHILLLVMLVKSNFVTKMSYVVGALAPELTTHYYQMLASHKRMDATVPSNATVFIGDSITAGLATSAVAAYSVNYGIGSDTTFGVLNRLPWYKSLHSANAIIIAIGVNDLPRRDNDSILLNYKKILDLLPHNTTVIVSAILPVDERVARLQAYNSRITAINTALQHLVAQYSHTVFINCSDALQGADGNLSTAYHSGDGIHLSAAGYQTWINQLKQTLDEAGVRKRD